MELTDFKEWKNPKYMESVDTIITNKDYYGVACGDCPIHYSNKKVKVDSSCYDLCKVKLAKEFKRLVEEETMKMNKVKMVIGENRVVECGEYDVKWRYGTDYKLGGDLSGFEIFDREKNLIHQTIFRCYNYKQQMEIANLILDKLGLNVELVEEDVNSEVLEQIGKLEAELEKLRGMIR